jgi:hypothetical protein
VKVLCFVVFPVQWKLNLKKQSLEIYHNEKQGCLWSNEYWYDNVNFLQIFFLAGGGFCCGKTISGNNKEFPHGGSLLLEQVTFRWDDDDICFVLDQHTEFDFYCTNSLNQQSAGSYRNVVPLKTY